MPAKSKSQLRAMFAAAQGKSTLGIPKSVGKDFASATGSSSGLPEKLGKLAKARHHKKKQKKAPDNVPFLSPGKAVVNP